MTPRSRLQIFSANAGEGETKDTNPSHFKGDDLPVEQVSWHDCQDFLRKLSKRAGKKVRLLTEAEWEYCCRAGSTTDYYFGDDETSLGKYAWFSENSKQSTHPVGSLAPNAWGLFDMHGNVWQWCEDWYDTEQKYRVLRGGSWGSGSGFCRAAYRLGYAPANRDGDVGLRVVLCSR
jgi:formylglycine-generating enzyme required for sulfatase activity